MKHLIFSLLILLFAESTNAQTDYESPHVKDGKTIWLPIPEGYYELPELSSPMDAMYASKKDVDLQLMDLDGLQVGLISISHTQGEGQSLELMMEDLNSESRAEIVALGGPEIVKINDINCMIAGFKGNIIADEIDRMYFGAIEFGDYFIVVNYLATVGTENYMEYSEFKKMMSSLKEIATTKEDGMDDFEEYIYEDEDGDFLEEETNYINDIFETRISFFDVLPDFDENWDIPIDENSHLLSEFVFKEGEGFIKVFSGGEVSNYPTDKEKAAAIQTVMELPTRLSLKKDTEFSNEDHHFQLYSISGGGTMTSVYTTLVNNELVFFVVDGGSKPAPDFKPAVRDLMLTMWVDYYDDDELAPED